MRRRARTDANHADVVQALRSCGWVVLDTSRCGDGFPDLVAARRGVLELIEVKDGSKAKSRQALTKDEFRVISQLSYAGVRVRIITSAEEAVEL